MVTEAIAMFMGRLTRDPEWLAGNVGAELSDDDRLDLKRQLRTAMLVAMRWMLVMSYFERELYRDPDRPDLEDLWWGLVEEIQRVRRPDDRDASDWATKIHLSLAPVYYHNYLLGELIASQLGARIRATPGDETGDAAAGDFLRDRVFSAGSIVPWNELIERATGAPLSASDFIRDFVS
jgi:peptidyl-dipeptidase A